MNKFSAIPFLFLLIGMTASAWAQRPILIDIPESLTFSTEPLEAYRGALIRYVNIEGRARTAEQALRWLLGGKEGLPFSPEAWVQGLKKIYSTKALYELQTEIRPVGPEGESAIDITLHLKEKWTLVPYFTSQGGGGATYWNAGVWDTNFGGYFTEVSAGAGALNGSAAYEVYAVQEWLLGSDYWLETRVSRDGYPNGMVDFVWAREQQRLVLGWRVSPDQRLAITTDFFRDEIVSRASSVNLSVYDGQQVEIQPRWYLGRIHPTNYLEEGRELSLISGFANPGSTEHAYSSLKATFRFAAIAFSDLNFAGRAQLGTMTSAPTPYLFRLGGFEGVRGFNADRLYGRSFWNTNAEVRPVFGSHRFGWFLLDRIAFQGIIFLDAGGTAEESLMAGGLGFRMNFVRYPHAILRFDLAHTIRPDEGWGFAFGVGHFF